MKTEANPQSPEDMILTGNTTPPGGWTYTQEESGFTMKALTPTELKSQIHAHRRANNFDLESGWWELVQLELCQDPEIEKRYCREPGDLTPKERKINIYDLLRFFRTVREWVVRNGFQKAPPETIAARADICADCPFNVVVKGCTGCQGVLRWLGEFLGQDAKVPREVELDNCRVCGCVLKLKICLPEEVILAASNPQEEYPDHCWMPK